MKPDLEILTDEPYVSPNYSYHSIRVKNKGRAVAMNCNAVLTITTITEKDVIDVDGQYPNITTSAFRPIKDESLCWAFKTRGPTGDPVNPAFLSIFPGSTRLVDLCRVPRQPFRIDIPSEMGWEKIRVFLRGDKEYFVELNIFPENVRHDSNKHRAKFKLLPGNEKKDIVIERLPC
jgi:hypothetical protein